MIAYLNGEFLPIDQCAINVQDRGFMLADGVYDVWVSHNVVFAHTADHMERLQYGLSQLRIELPMDIDEVPKVALKLQEKNNLTNTQMYIQVTRGVGPRGHRFPEGVKATVVMIARAASFPTSEERQAGIRCAMVPDQRWGRCDIKSTSLLANVLASQAAVEKGASEAILCRDGIAIEGASSNFFAVMNGVVHTYPTGPRILGGVTRRYVLRYAEKLGIPVRHEPIPEEAVWTADELFITSVSRDVLPVTCVDGKTVGGGRMGPVARALYEEFHLSHWGHRP